MEGLVSAALWTGPRRRGFPPSFLDIIVRECLPLYCSITRATVVSGTSTAFWFDKWLPGMPLALRFPALFSHVTRPHASVVVVSSTGLSLQPRLTAAAERELDAVRAILSSVALAGGQDLCCLDSPTSPPFSSGGAYRMLSPRHAPDVSACTSWGLRLPSKVRIFSYLADIDRLSTQANLFFKNCASLDICAACTSPETGRHLFFDRRLATDVWRRLHTPVPNGGFSIWDLPSPRGTTTHIWHAGVATILWSIWKARNDLVFNGRPSTAAMVLRRAGDDLELWRWRYKIHDRGRHDDLRSIIMLAAV